MFYAGQNIKVYANQGYRDAVVLAILSNEALIEYEMPKGTTALRVIDCVTEGTLAQYSYATVPIRWIAEMFQTETEWTGNPQKNAEWVQSVKELYEGHCSKKNGVLK